jgi:hypothetical protein
MTRSAAPLVLLFLLAATAAILGIAAVRASAGTPAAVGSAADPLMAAAILAPPAPAAGTAQDAPAGGSAGPAAPAGPAPPPSIIDIQRLWSSGAPLAALLLALHIALLALVRFDPRRAWKWTGSAGAVGLLAEAASSGTTPPVSMIMTALGILAALWLPGAGRTAAKGCV